jgi:hypothetical protein
MRSGTGIVFSLVEVLHPSWELPLKDCDSPLYLADAVILANPGVQSRYG